MTQAQLHRIVAGVTGESVEFISARGFQHQVAPSQQSLRHAERLLRFRQSARRKKLQVRAGLPNSAA